LVTSRPSVPLAPVTRMIGISDGAPGRSGRASTRERGAGCGPPPAHHGPRGLQAVCNRA
jgi:hypothetical protein